jgi:hypothetical protein
VSAAVHFLVSDLTKWDASPSDALALAFFTDERPLRGAAGLVDWRLCGRLSRLLRAGKLTGGRGETTIVPPAGRRLPFPRLILFGLGDSRGFDEQRYREEVRRMREVVKKAGVSKYAVQPPGRSTGLIAPRRALELWMEEASKDGIAAEVTIVESGAGQKEMAEALRGRR